MASLLLRLFHSDYFSPHLALSYLRTYADNIGITYYLVYRLRTSFSPEEVEFYWPQLCHLLITKPSESRALECFVLERCEESVHVALLTLWYLQATLFDLGSQPNTASFEVCKRVYNECQRILYDDPLSDANVSLVPAQASSSSSSTSTASNSRFRRLISSSARAREKVSPRNTRSTYVGIGTVLASVPAMPSLAGFSGQIAVEQGRAKPNAVNAKKGEGLAKGIERIGKGEGSDDEGELPGRRAGDESEDDDDEDEESEAEATQQTTRQPVTPKSAPLAQRQNTAPSGSILAKGSGSSGPSATSPDNPFANFSAGFSKATASVGEAFGQTFGVTFNTQPQGDAGKDSKARPAWHPQSPGKGSRRARSNEVTKSTPNLANGSRTSLSAFASTATLPDSNHPASMDAVLAQYDTEARRRLLRSNYCRTQTQFLLTLQDISARLLLLPKPARLSALRAELTALNHKLPSDVCFPLWCAAISETGTAGEDSQNAIENAHNVPGASATSSSLPSTSVGRGQQQQPKPKRRPGELRHHRVVRINPSEAVVLNSADRAPYLLHVEVLTDELDFDPERRSNRESLKKLVVAEDLRRRKFALSRAFGTEGSESGSREALGAAGLLRRDSGPGAVGMLRRDSVKSGGGSAIDSPRIDSSASTPGAAAVESGTEPRSRLAERTVSSSSVSFGQSAAASTPEPALRPGAAAGSDSRPSSPMPDESGEEIDLTEQAFGADLSAFGEERQEASDEEDDLTAINRHHDAAAWTQARGRAGSIPTSSGGAGGVVSPQSSGHGRQGSISGTSGRRRDLSSLDDYSDRMRTAAIMLAQLNQSTNAASQPAVTHNPHISATAQGGWSSWIIGTSWAAGGSSASSTAANGAGPKSEIGQGSAGVKAPISVAAAPPTSGAIAADPTKTAAKSSSGPNGAPAAPVVAGGGSRLIHADTEMIRKRIMQEMMALEEERMERMKSSGSRKIGSSAASRRPAPTSVEDEATVLRAVNKDDPSAAMFRETWAAKKARIRAASPYGHLPSWDVFSVIVKTGADLRQEQLAVQLINEFGRIWEEKGSRLWVRYFRILVTSESSGLMETITDAVSVHSIKKEAYARAQKDGAGGPEGGKIATYSIYDHFVDTYGDPSSARFNRARDRFMESLAAYSIISYLLSIKDRHNGNILLSSDGRIIHIDFGFMLGISPGGVGFEACPFKLTQEYIDVLGGIGSPKYEEFKKLMRQGFKDVRKEAERIIMIVELMAKDSKLPCFALGDLTASNLRDRFALALSAQQVDDFVDRLILASCASSYTRLYDTFQYYSQGIL
ncbi:hypothetical protein BDZ90DRAFT_230571 [Jaminaea rosea]|uniref:1-phosphatidylinositol 4-kinase n=1 Tax=Jaminaea rosea TaxID=1569628 RepID=A0A316UWQ9_9BASI|nr:hypothetical protein BDZ90DRAFT_230571 [Jaminaea rosea]PWN29719.1 hypothetical protein BDZ90DRAFT_230571 [Jaminaea rosea]